MALRDAGWWADGWQVVFDELSFDVRKRGKDGYEVFSIGLPDFGRPLPKR